MTGTYPAWQDTKAGATLIPTLDRELGRTDLNDRQAPPNQARQADTALGWEAWLGAAHRCAGSKSAGSKASSPRPSGRSRPRPARGLDGVRPILASQPEAAGSLSTTTTVLHDGRPDPQHVLPDWAEARPHWPRRPSAAASHPGSIPCQGPAGAGALIATLG